MLVDVINYSGIFAKIKTMQSRLLTNDDYLHLATMPSVHDIGAKLKELPSYREFFENLSESQLRREPLERKLRFSLYNDFAKIYNFISNTKNNIYLNAYSKIFEIEILKLLLRAILDERDINFALPESNLLIRNRIKIDIQKLLSCSEISEFINGLSNTEYYTVLSGVHKTKPSLFYMEMQLDLHYYLTLWKTQNKYLDDKNKKLQAHVNGIEIDIHNMFWILRAKNYYNIENSIIYTHVIPIHYKLSSSDLTKLVETKTIDDFFDVVSKTYYHNFFSEYNKITVEQIHRKYMYNIHHDTANLNSYSLSTVTSYIHKKDQEIKNITSIIEGTRYALSKSEILNHILLPQHYGVEGGK